MFFHFYSGSLFCLFAKAAPCFSGFGKWALWPIQQDAILPNALDDHLCNLYNASWNFTTGIYMNKTPDQTAEDNSPTGIVQFHFLGRRLIKPAFILGFIFLNIEDSLVNCFYFLVTEDFRWQKDKNGIQHKKPGLLKQHGNAASRRAKQPGSKYRCAVWGVCPWKHCKTTGYFLSLAWHQKRRRREGGRQDERQSVLSKALVPVLLLQPPPPLPSLNSHSASASALLGSASALLPLWIQQHPEEKMSCGPSSFKREGQKLNTSSPDMLAALSQCSRHDGRNKIFAINGHLAMGQGKI